MRKAIDHDALMADMERINAAKNKKNKSLSIDNDALFSVNINKTGLKSKREKLAKDRFKPEQYSQSAAEAVLVKRLREKKAAAGNTQAPPTKKQKTGDDLVDLWASGDSKSKNQVSFESFKSKATKVKPRI